MKETTTVKYSVADDLFYYANYDAIKKESIQQQQSIKSKDYYRKRVLIALGTFPGEDVSLDDTIAKENFQSVEDARRVIRSYLKESFPNASEDELLLREERVFLGLSPV